MTEGDMSGRGRCSHHPSVTCPECEPLPGVLCQCGQWYGWYARRCPDCKSPNPNHNAGTSATSATTTAEHEPQEAAVTAAHKAWVEATRDVDAAERRLLAARVAFNAARGAPAYAALADEVGTHRVGPEGLEPVERPAPKYDPWTGRRI